MCLDFDGTSGRHVSEEIDETSNVAKKQVWFGGYCCPLVNCLVDRVHE